MLNYCNEYQDFYSKNVVNFWSVSEDHKEYLREQQIRFFILPCKFIFDIFMVSIQQSVALFIKRLRSECHCGFQVLSVRQTAAQLFLLTRYTRLLGTFFVRLSRSFFFNHFSQKFVLAPCSKNLHQGLLRRIIQEIFTNVIYWLTNCRIVTWNLNGTNSKNH